MAWGRGSPTRRPAKSYQKDRAASGGRIPRRERPRQRPIVAAGRPGALVTEGWGIRVPWFAVQPQPRRRPPAWARSCGQHHGTRQEMTPPARRLKPPGCARAGPAGRRGLRCSRNHAEYLRRGFVPPSQAGRGKVTLSCPVLIRRYEEPNRVARP